VHTLGELARRAIRTSINEDTTMESKESQSNTGNLAATAARGVEGVSATAHEKVNQMSEAARPAVDRLTSNAHAAIDTVAGAAATAVDTFDIKSEQLSKTQAKLVEAARDYMREQPVASLGIAVAAGWVLSRLLR
jgi:ElaB/YqjD/DUF883 family membrane-anchored ribosome-binding protein